MFAQYERSVGGRRRALERKPGSGKRRFRISNVGRAAVRFTPPSASQKALRVTVGELLGEVHMK